MNTKVRKENRKLKNQSISYSEYYGMTEIFDELYKRSSEGAIFHKLMDTISSNANILLSYRTIKRNKGSKSEGIDGITIRDLEKLPQEEFIRKVQKRFKRYLPRKVKRVEIPKENGKMRPLGIPSIWDRITQQCILQVLEPICEAKFYKHSYGFRPLNSAENAIGVCMYRMNHTKMSYVVDMDIQSFFDEVNHTKLMRQIWTLGIRDKQLLVIIRKILKAPIVMPTGETIIPTKGTPQGGVLSPLLANINLNEFDWWIANQWEERDCKELKPQFNKKGVRDKANSYRKLRNKTSLKEMYIVRYCDDFKIFCRNRSTANKIYHAIEMWLEERLKLPISKEKSKVTNLKKESSEFLGFSLRLVEKSNRHVCHSHVSAKAQKRIKGSLKAQMKCIRKAEKESTLKEEIRKYNCMVIGIHNYYNKATHVNRDFNVIGYQMMRSFYNRFKREGLTSRGKYDGKDKGIRKYMSSKMVRYLNGYPILPIDYVQTKISWLRKRNINIYTVEGRKLIHETQKSVEEWKIQWLREHPIISERASIEYNDNRLSLFIAQKGRCAVSGIELVLEDVHCHHKELWSKTKDDSYHNLIIIHKEIHYLIHATDGNFISIILNRWNLNEKQLEKLNKLRKLINNSELKMH
ncbi:group II intron reverse transcriptase/maturase [Breznakia pachnodae]|uniref:Group II intron reverse transcriptase/maturase n=1 Tax=Breznakia pachnodae TaxID=265178 RepID=A0ABU0E6Z1_9FIRM|nr:group II intron reverse transcriptase/maturase [Breznakia pachnodae]MDQ0362481.1 group II intron reverse transcriptase/maturase [Breznakia pachnodae]